MKTVNTILNFIIEHWELVGALIYEILARVIPTKKNISLLDNTWKILDWFVRNKRKPDGSENVVGFDEKGRPKNFITIRTDKHALTILFLLCTFAGFAQSPVISQQRAAMFTTGGTQDTVQIKNTRTSLQNINGNTGGLYFDKVRNKWRIWIGTCAACPADSAWVDLIGLGNGLITASNGLTKTGSNIKLGGTLTGTTTFIDGTVANTQSLLIGNVTPLSAFSANANTVNLAYQGGGIAYNLASTGGVFTGKHTFTPTSSLAGFNMGLLAGNPLTLTNGDQWYNSTTGLVMFRQGGSNVGLGTTETASNGLTKTLNNITLGGTLTDPTFIETASFAGFNFLGDGDIHVGTTGAVSFGDGIDNPSSVNLYSSGEFAINSTGILTLAASNITVNATSDFNQKASFLGNTPIRITGTTAGTNDGDMWRVGGPGSHFKYRDDGVNYNYVTNSSDFSSTRIPYASSGFNLTSEAAFTYDATLNKLSVTNAATTSTTDDFGGEIQLNHISTSNRLTINTSATDQNIFSSSGDDLKITSGDDLKLETASAKNIILSTASGDPQIESATDLILFGDGTNAMNLRSAGNAQLAIQAGATTQTGNNGATLTLTTNNTSFDTGTGGQVNITAGNATGTNGTGGSVTITPGTGNTSNGNISLAGGKLTLDRTITAGGTTGDQTINKMAGTVNIAAGNSSVVVTNSYAAANSIIFAVVRTNDATAAIKNVVPTVGSFTIRLTAAATAETSIGFWVTN